MKNNYFIRFLIVVTAAVSITWWVTNLYWGKKWAARDLNDMRIEVTAKKKQQDIERQTQQAITKTDQTVYKELEDAKKNINDLRNAINTGQRRLQHCQQTNIINAKLSDDRTAGVGNNGGAINGSDSREIEQNILDLGEKATIAIKQRDACIQIYQQTQQILKR